MSGQCDFCNIWHSGSCCHPGRARLSLVESQLSQVQGELLEAKEKLKSIEEYGIPPLSAYHILESKCNSLKAENEQLIEGIFATKAFADLKAENERLKANKHLVTSDEGTSYCAQCERYARERDKFKAALESINFMVDAQAKDEGLWSVPLEGLQPIIEAYLQQELRRLHECVEHYAKQALQPREGE